MSLPLDEEVLHDGPGGVQTCALPILEGPIPKMGSGRASVATSKAPCPGGVSDDVGDWHTHPADDIFSIQDMSNIDNLAWPNAVGYMAYVGNVYEYKKGMGQPPEAPFGNIRAYMDGKITGDE